MHRHISGKTSASAKHPESCIGVNKWYNKLDTSQGYTQSMQTKMKWSELKNRGRIVILLKFKGLNL